MKIMHRIIFLGLTLLLAPLVLAKRPAVEARVERCKVALAYANALLSQLHDRVVFTDEGEQAYFRVSAGGWLTEDGSPSISPPADLLRTANRRGRVDALSSCPSMARGLKRASGDRRLVSYRSRIEVDGNGRRDPNEVGVGITLPVISSDNKSAILFSSQVSGPLAGGIYAYYLRYSARNGWVVVSSKGFAVA